MSLDQLPQKSDRPAGDGRVFPFTADELLLSKRKEGSIDQCVAVNEKEARWWRVAHAGELSHATTPRVEKLIFSSTRQAPPTEPALVVKGQRNALVPVLPNLGAPLL